METRTCKVCGVEKPFAHGTWVWSSKRGAFGNTCLMCNCQRVMQRNRANKSRYNEKHAEWRANNRNVVAKRNAEWAAKNPEQHQALKRRSSAVYRQRHKELLRRRKKDNAAYYLAHTRKRQAAKLHRTPQWLTPADNATMEAKYAMAKWLSDVVGVAYHVDHIVPLQGKNVSGLHVPDNLAVIRAAENIAKANKWNP